MRKRQRRVKIIATLGPASSHPEQIQRLFEAGADVFRINMSHTSHDQLRELHAAIREIETIVKRPIGILVDLQGPKLRIGNFKDSEIDLKEGTTFHFDQTVAAGSTERVCLPHPEIFEAIKIGHMLILDDGKLRLKVTDKNPDQITSVVCVGGKLSSRKGVSLPDTLLPMGAMTEKDFSDLDAAMALSIDWIALSFVQRAEDIIEVRQIVGQSASIMAKIEKPSAITELDQIIALSDGLMIARGDLGVEMPVEQVPALQKKITRAARKAGKPVVVATQMLESMIAAPVPTRAEVSDVATAVFESTDAIMLSAESAVGDYSVEAVAMMDTIAKEIEKDPIYDAITKAQRTKPEATGADAISAAARDIAETLKLAAIACYTSSGATGLRVARERPKSPLIALTPIIETSRKMTLVWGVHSVLTGDPENLDDMVKKACHIVCREGSAKPGERIIVTAGVPLGTPGATNMLRIALIEEDVISPAP